MNYKFLNGALDFLNLKNLASRSFKPREKSQKPKILPSIVKSNVEIKPLKLSFRIIFNFFIFLILGNGNAEKKTKYSKRNNCSCQR